MDFELGAEQREIQELAREFAGREIEPHAAAWDSEHRFPREVFAKLADLGLMGVCVPEEYGGAGADFLSYIVVLEELSRADAGVGVTVAVHTSATTLPLLLFGTDEQKARFEQRIDDPDRHWKISESDFDERRYWSDYTSAYEEALEKCSTKCAPWFVIPSNKKWFRNLAVSHIIVEALEEMDMKFPAPTVDVKKLKWK